MKSAKSPEALLREHTFERFGRSRVVARLGKIDGLVHALPGAGNDCLVLRVGQFAGFEQLAMAVSSLTDDDILPARAAASDSPLNAIIV
nr:hypothetical protein RAR13_28225 [Aminobacter niigataensis]